MAKLRVGIIFGGQSGEHDVSLVSARAILGSLDPDRYDVVPIGISKGGRWLRPADAVKALNAGLSDLPDATHVTLLPEPGYSGLVAVENGSPIENLDVIFPVLHGTNGEDGTVQGLLELANIPYVGSGVLGSSVGMDKVAMKTAFATHGFPQVEFQLVRKTDWINERERVLAALTKRFTFPVFVKPANLGSSVGISKVKTEADLAPALDLAARYDRRIIVEQGLEGVREIECAILGNHEPMASVVGEVIPGNEFYDYEDKYLNNRSKSVIPAALDEEIAHKVRGLAIMAFMALDLAGMARVDFFVTADGQVYLNEVNTIPGFTPISQYPKLWEASGLPYEKLLDRLLELALERHAEKAQLTTDFTTPKPVA